MEGGFNQTVLVRVYPAVNEIQERIEIGAGVLPGDLVVEIPPDMFDGIGLRRKLGQEVDYHPCAVNSIALYD